MSLRQSLAQWRLDTRPPHAESLTAAYARTLGQQGPGIDDRPREDLSAVAARFLAAIRSGQKPAVRDWNRVSWCLWTTSPAIADHPAGLGALLDRVTASRRPRPFRQLASVYLAEFRPDRPQLERIADRLRDGADAAGEPWRTLQRRHGVFDGSAAIGRIARVALQGRTSVVAVLRASGIASLDARAGFVEAGYRAGLDEISRSRPTGVAAWIERLRSFGLDEAGRLPFPQHRAEVARALVMPFAEQRTSESDIGLLCGLVLDLFGDPRIRRGDWIGMDDVAEVVKRWLVKASLRQFLDVVDRVAPPQQWEYRRTFWTAVHEAGLIDDAYVAFDPAGAKIAARAFKDAPYGVLRSGDGQIQEGHTVLLLRIGPAVVSDWSHNGRCNIWERSDEADAPALHRPNYGRNDLRKTLPNTLDETQRNRLGVYTHSGAPNYLWQKRVADHLYRITGVRVPPQAYAV